MRELRADDRDLLLEATLCNVNWVEERFTRDDVLTNPYFRHYYDPWQESDFGYVAENSNGGAIGVVWLRFFTADDPASASSTKPPLNSAYGSPRVSAVGELVVSFSTPRSAPPARKGSGVSASAWKRVTRRADSMNAPGLHGQGRGLTPGRWC